MTRVSKFQFERNLLNNVAMTIYYRGVVLINFNRKVNGCARAVAVIKLSHRANDN